MWWWEMLFKLSTSTTMSIGFLRLSLPSLASAACAWLGSWLELICKGNLIFCFFPFFSVSVDVDDKVRALDEDIEDNNHDKKEEADMDENVYIVCIKGFICRKGEGLI